MVIIRKIQGKNTAGHYVIVVVNDVIDMLIESLGLSGRTSDCGNRRSEVRFLTDTQNFFFVARS